MLSGNWQPNDECGALTLRALDLNCSATLLDDLARSCKTDARAWNASRDFAGTPKTLEDSRDFTSWNAESMIFHLQDRPLTSVQVLPVGTHDNLATVWTVFQSVRQQVLKGTFESRGVPLPGQ